MFRKSFVSTAATAAIGAAVALAPAIASARAGGHGGGGHGGGGYGGGGHGVAMAAHGGGMGAHALWVAGSALADSAAVDSPSAGTVWRVRSPFMAAAGFTTDASTAVFAALPSTAAPPTPTATITATIAAGSGIPAAPATCAFGCVDRSPR